MFCPEGYSTISGIFEMFFMEQFDKMVAHCRERCRRSDDVSLAEYVHHFFSISPADMVEFEMWRAIQDEVCMCSPEGRVLRLDMKSLRGALDFWEFTQSGLEEEQARVKGVPEVPYDFRYMFNTFDFPKDEFVSEFEKYSADARDATMWDFAESLNMHHRHHQLPMFFERTCYTITLRAFDYINHFDFLELDEFRDTARMLRPFEGWAMCVRTEVAEGVDLKRRARAAYTEQSNQSCNGRPDILRRESRQAFEELYPDGRGGDSWLVALRKVNARTGRNASLDTLKRAVADAKGRLS